MTAVPQKNYLDRITKLVSLARPGLSKTHNLEYKNCFGAVAGYIEGQIFISYGKFGVALKLPPKKINELFKESDVKPLKYFPNGHIKKDYAVLPRRIIENNYKLTCEIIETNPVPVPQDEEFAVYYDRRKPADSQIVEHNLPLKSWYDFIRMLADPYPNAFLKIDDKKIIFKNAEWGMDKITGRYEIE